MDARLPGFNGRSVRDLPPDLVVAHQRRRLLAALATEVATRGYDELSVEHVVCRAGVSRRTVYELYDGKAALFLAAHADALTWVCRLVRSTCSERFSWREHVCAGVAAVLDGAAAEPDRALLLAAPGLVAGPHAAECRRRLGQAFRPYLSAAAPVAAPPSLGDAALAGLAETVGARILAAEVESLSALAAALSALLLVWFPGPGGAA